MPALRPTPATAPVVERQLGNIGGGLRDAGAAIGGGVQTGIAGAGGGVATAVSGAGGGVATAVSGASGAIETVAHAPNAAISAGVDAAGDKMLDDFKKKALVPCVVAFCFIVFFILVFWRWRHTKKRDKTFLGKPKGGKGEAAGDNGDDGKS